MDVRSPHSWHLFLLKYSNFGITVGYINTYSLASQFPPCNVSASRTKRIRRSVDLDGEVFENALFAKCFVAA